MKCVSCSINVKTEEGCSSFKCPNCSKEIIRRCEKCRKNSIAYRCKCGFEGP
ncbi:MAG: zinc finger domain-containing protein [Candidatus Aenigmatarchaeota archaeon]